MTKYLCTDGNADIEIEASSAQEAAQEYVDGGDWGDGTETTWVTVYVQRVIAHALDEEGQCEGECGQYGVVRCGSYPEPCADPAACPVHDGSSCLGQRDSRKVAVEPDEPACSHEDGHDWDDDVVQGSGGGVAITNECLRCGVRRTLDTWAQDPTDGEQGLRSVEYRRAAKDGSVHEDAAAEDAQ